MRLSLVLALVLAVADSTATPQSQQAPVFGAEVAVVTLPAYVTDKDGQPVTGLTVEDFEVTDDGRPVQIAGFQEIDAGAPLVREAFAGAMATRRQFLFLFDLSFTTVPGLLRAQRAAADFAKQMLPHDLAAVATFSTKGGTKLLLGFTSDRSQIEAAILRLGVADSERRADPLMLTYDTGMAEQGASEGVTRESLIQEELRTQQVLLSRMETQVYQQNVRGLLGSLGQLARALDLVQGRKQVLYFSAGFDSSALVGDTAEQAQENAQKVVEGRIWEVDSNRYGDAGLRSGLDQVLRALSGADVVVHTVDVTGLAARGDLGRLDGDVAIGVGRDSLARIASGTGGRIIKDANNLGQAMTEILDRTRHYYVVAFEPATSRGVGKYHRLKVRVRTKGVQIASRTGYVEKDPAFRKTSLAANLQAGEAILKGVGGGEIALSAVAVPYRDPKGMVSLPVALEVDGKTLVGDSGSKVLPLQFYGYALDPQGQVEDTVAIATSLDLSKLGAKLQERGLQIQTVFAVPPGRHDLRFLVRDAESGRRGVWRAEVTVPEFKPGEMILAAPLVTEDPDQWVVLRNPSHKGKGLDLPFRVEGSPFVPLGRPRFANGQNNTVCVLLYDGGIPNAQAIPLEVNAQILNAQGKPVRLGRMQMAKSSTETDGFRRFVFQITPNKIAGGDYPFRVRVKDPASGKVLEATTSVTIR